MIRSHNPYSKQNNSEGTSENWSLSSNRLILFKKRLYIPPVVNLRRILLELHYNDPLTRHFRERRISELLKINFY